MVKRAAEWRRSKCSTRLSNQTVLQTRMRSRKIAIARRCRRDPASAYPAIRDGWRASAPAPHDRGPHLAFNRGDFAMNAGFVAGFVGDAETHGLQHPGVALVERHPFFARGFDSSSSFVAVVTLAGKNRLCLNAPRKRLLVTLSGKKPCDINKRLDSERFRSTPRTCRPFCGRLSVRKTGRTGLRPLVVMTPGRRRMAWRGREAACST